LTERAPLPPINFKALADALLARAHQLLPAWLPGGEFELGKEYVVRSCWRAEKTASLKIRISGDKAGTWADFGGDHSGADLIALYAAIHGLGAGQAALQLARQEGLEDVAGVLRAGHAAGAPPPPPPPPAPPPPSRPPPEDRWQPIMPVPAGVPEPTFQHQYRAREDITHTAAYRLDGHLLGYIVRHRRSDGGKEVSPYTWCRCDRDGGMRWVWKLWGEPRPLYLPGGRKPDGRTAVVVEGEKKADALHALLEAACPGVYCVVAWPGGCKVWRKASWAWIAGATVLLWPDCDAHRVKLTNAERQAVRALVPEGGDKAAHQLALDVALRAAQDAKPILPAHKQPGIECMLGLGAHLRGEQGCTVQMLPIPAPGAVKDGWDADDAINADGWDAERVLAFFGRAQPLDADADARKGASKAGGGGGDAPPPGGAGEGPAGADGQDERDAFQAHIDFVCQQLDKEPWQLGVDRKMLIAALRKAPALAGCLGTNLMFDGPATIKPWPWRQAAGALSDVDHLRLGDWVSRTYKLKSASAEGLQSAMETVADENHFHPIRDWLGAQAWDGKPRLEKWLAHVLRIEQARVSGRRWRYLGLMGRYLLLGLVARVMDPGCKFDYSPVFEGRTGRGKSTLIETLVGADHFSDTHFDIGSGKDGMEQLRGIWAYELSEMTAFRRADSEQVKQFFSSKVDRYRSSYGRYVQPHPRQCVIVCSTNKRRYLYDLTSQRRFWPVWVDEFIRIEWVRKWRAQLFAEALAAFKGGERIFPTPEEEAEFFLPEQRMRLVETTIHAKMYELLTRDGAPATEHKITAELSANVAFVTKQRMVEAMGTDAGKSSVQVESQVASWFEYYDWTYKRESTGARRYGYHRPAVWPPEVPDDEEDTRPPADAAEGSDEGGDAPPTAAGEDADDAPF
jgi:predicted P-loop ATPase